MIRFLESKRPDGGSFCLLTKDITQSQKCSATRFTCSSGGMKSVGMASFSLAATFLESCVHWFLPLDSVPLQILMQYNLRHPLISCSDSCHHTVSIRQQLKAGSCVCTYAFGSPVVQFTTGHSMIFARSSLSNFNQLLRPPSQTEERAVPAISNSAVPRFGCKA